MNRNVVRSLVSPVLAHPGRGIPLIRKIALLSCAVSLAGTAFAGAVAHATVTIFDATNDVVHCSTNYGTLTITPPFTSTSSPSRSSR